MGKLKDLKERIKKPMMVAIEECSKPQSEVDLNKIRRKLYDIENELPNLEEAEDKLDRSIKDCLESIQEMKDELDDTEDEVD
jgi:chromosome segregation ATPase